MDSGQVQNNKTLNTFTFDVSLGPLMDECVYVKVRLMDTDGYQKIRNPS